MRNSRNFVDSRVESIIEIIEALDLPHTKQKCQSFPVVADLDNCYNTIQHCYQKKPKNTAPIRLKLNVFGSNFRQLSYQVSLSLR